MTTTTGYALYKCDAWKRFDSLQLLFVATSLESLIKSHEIFKTDDFKELIKPLEEVEDYDVINFINGNPNNLLYCEKIKIIN